MIYRRFTVPGILLFFLILGCGKSPGGIPPVQTGDLKVSAFDNSALIDSLWLTIDDQFYGTFQNPHIVSGLAAGRHKIAVDYDGFVRSTQMVTVLSGVLNEMIAPLFATGPYPGSYAPGFCLNDVSGNTITLEDYRGKAVLLFFFPHT